MKQFMMFILLTGALAGLYAQTAVIQEITGKVEVKVSGGDWVPAVTGQTINNATTISTSFKSTAVINLGNSVLTMKPLTRLTLEELRETAGTEKVDLYLTTGRVQAEVTPPAGGKTDFTVRTPSVTASVRGTSFEQTIDKLDVDGGSVFYQGGAGQGPGQYVQGGEAASVDNLQGINVQSKQETLIGGNQSGAQDNLTSSPPALTGSIDFTAPVWHP
jgi:hypothetical protein